MPRNSPAVPTRPNASNSTARYDRLNELLRHHDAYNVDHQVEQVLDGLGFASADYHRAVRTFSGGQQSRLMLAKLLLAAPDVMLLDEPSNHLDIDTTRWLEDYLVEQPEAMLIVSHDRYFLDRVVTKVFELHDQPDHDVTPATSSILAAAPGALRAATEGLGSRSGSTSRSRKSTSAASTTASCTSRPQSRQKALDQLERVERPTQGRGAAHALRRGRRRSGDVVLHVEDLTKAYGDQPLFENLSFDLPRGKRLGIMGPNGSGKTTLLQILLGEEEPDSGQGAARPPGRVRLSRPAPEAADRREAGDPGRLAGRRPDAHRAEDARPARPLRAGRRQVVEQVGEAAQRRRAQPGGAGEARRSHGRQRAGPRRADQPPRPLGLRLAGAGAARRSRAP